MRVEHAGHGIRRIRHAGMDEVARKQQQWQIEEWDDAAGALDDEEDSPELVYPLRRENRLKQRRSPSRRDVPDAADDERVPRARPAVRRRRPGEPEEFRCRHCRQFVVSVPSGGRHRNHCPYCLHSRHVDERMPGDRLSPCGGTMAPVGMFVRAGGEYALVHRCMECGVERHNRIAADDDIELVQGLPDITDREPGMDEVVGEGLD
jgi:RNHCP domain